MPVYAVERLLPGATLEAVEAMGCAANEAARAFGAQGRPVRYLRSTFIPGESRCQSFFEAPNADLVQELNDTTQLPYSRIVLAVEFPRDAPIESHHSRNPDSH
jgi:hypothetical protein